MEKTHGIALWIWIILFIIAWFFLFWSTLKSGTHKDIELFNSMNADNYDLNICNKIETLDIQEKCRDNYHSLKAFHENNINECENIKMSQLKQACITKFKQYEPTSN